MKNNPYQQFFSKAQALKRSDAPTKPKRRAAPLPPAPQVGERHELALRNALKMKTKKRPPFPWKAGVTLALSLAGGAFYLSAPDTVERWLSHVEVRAFGQAEAADAANPKAGDTPAASDSTAGKGSAEKSTTKSSKAEKAADSKDSASSAKSPAEGGAVNEELSQFSKLKQRKEELDEREKELNELEEELQRQKVELDKRIAQLEEMRTQISQTLKDRVEIDQEKVNKLVDLYSNMKPKQAADVIGSLNEELAVEVLAKMKKKKAAEVMNLLPADKARVLSEKYTGYRRISSQEPRG